MRNNVKLVGFTVMGISLALHAPPVTRADDSSFVAAAHSVGFQQPDDRLIRMALSACRMLQPNLRRNPAEVVEHVARYANTDPVSVVPPGRPPDPTGDPYKFVVLAVNEYCPGLAYRVPPA